MIEVKLTGLDSNQIPRYTYDETNNSMRVTVVAGELPNINVVPGEFKTPEVIIQKEYIKNQQFPLSLNIKEKKFVCFHSNRR